MRPTIRQLEYLVAVADHLNFRRAAEAVHVSQPGLSAQIQQLEQILGVTLFERDRRRVVVTDAGREAAARARHILGRVDDLAEAARGHRRPLTGRLRLGVIPSVAPYLLPQVLPGVRKRHPELRLLLREDTTERLVDAMQDGHLDVLLLALEARLDDVHVHPLFEDPFVLAAPTGHPLAKRKRVRESDLEGEPVLLLEDGHWLRDQALAVCHLAGAPEVGDFRASSLPTLVEMVAGGVGITLLPMMAVAGTARTQPALGFVPFVRPTPYRTIGLAWRQSSARAEEFALLGASVLDARETG